MAVENKNERVCLKKVHCKRQNPIFVLDKFMYASSVRNAKVRQYYQVTKDKGVLVDCPLKRPLSLPRYNLPLYCACCCFYELNWLECSVLLFYGFRDEIISRYFYHAMLFKFCSTKIKYLLYFLLVILFIFFNSCSVVPIIPLLAYPALICLFTEQMLLYPPVL